MANWRKKIKNPATQYRSAPFWSWNDQLQPKELKKQIDYMKEGGMGGGFIHSRIGLITPYLSEEWRQCIKATVKHAKKRKMLAYLYDEDRWPSGFAGNIVTKNKKNRMNLLQAKKNGRTWTFKVIQPSVSEWFNGATYPDTLSYETVSDFIESTYEYYRKHFKKYFNKTIPAIFTDEPHYKNWKKENIPVIPWTDKFRETFKKKFGYDIWNNLVSLFDKKGDWQKIRYDYWRHATELFVTNFGKQIYDWCEVHNLPLTGHYLAEENLISQVECIGSAMMFYEYMHWPGIDHLGRNLLTPVLFKQVSSAANQMSKKRVLSELYGCSGQSLDFAQRKWITDWHFIHGINLLCPHLYLYSLKGARKRDFPPTISHHQPYWKFNKYLEDYFARISYMLCKSQFIPQVLVIHPVESGWCLYSPGNTLPRLNQINKDFVNLNYFLLSKHYDYDLASEPSLESALIQDKTLILGNMQYKTVIIPSCLSLRKETVILLNNFIHKNGTVIMLEPLPKLIQGKKDDYIKELIKNAEVCNSSTFGKTLQKKVEKTISIKSRGKEIPMIFSTHRKLKKEEFFFIANLNEEKAYKADIIISGEDNFQLLDALENYYYSMDTVQKNGYTTFNIKLEPFQSIVIIRAKKKARLYTPPVKMKSIFKFNPNDFEIIPTQLNVVLLDNAKLKLNANKWSKPTPVVKLKHQLAVKYNNKEFTTQFEFRTHLIERPADMFLVIEDADRYKISINGKRIIYKNIGQWVDPCFKKINICEYIDLQGTNIIELKAMYKPLTEKGTLIYKKDGLEFEPIYIIGNFSVKGTYKEVKNKPAQSDENIPDNTRLHGYQGKNFIIIDKTNPDIRDIVRTGYPFYQGGFILKKEFRINKIPDNRLYIRTRSDAVVVSIKLNGTQLHPIFLPPYQMEVTGLLRQGKNQIEIEIVNTLRNLLGPHHMNQVENIFNTPWSFEVLDAGIDNYSFVPFGIQDISLLQEI